MNVSHWAVFVLVGLTMSLRAETRTWTDQRQRTLEGEMVRVVDDAVEIRMKDKTVKVKLSQLSDPDQEYVRQAAAAQSSDSEAGGHESGNSGSSGEMKIARRDWVIGGRKVRGKFVKYVDGEVNISTATRLAKHAYGDLSSVDQEYVCDVLHSRGELEQVPESQWAKKYVKAKQERLLAEARQRRAEEKKRQEEERAAEKAVADAEAAARAEARRAETRSRFERIGERQSEKRRASETAAASSPYPANASGVASTREAIPPEGTPTMPTLSHMPGSPLSPTQPASPSKDAYNRDLEVMQESNRNAYYFLGGVLGFLFLFGPIVYAFQRAR